MEQVTYNGWKNRHTWNVSLYINNDEPMYKSAVAFMRQNTAISAPYKSFVMFAGLDKEHTPDGTAFAHLELDYEELDEMMREIISNE